MNGRRTVKDEKWDRSFDKVNQTFGKSGERVLGFAKCHLPKQ
jgi:sodium/potassium-transporting ATPase subunit alpha